MADFSDHSADDLIRLCAGSRNTEAWAEFIRRFQPVIASAVLRTARNCGETRNQHIDDLIQDTFLKLCENESRMLREFKPQHKDSIFGYLKVVAENVVRDHFKSRKADKRGVDRTDPIDEAIQIDPRTARSSIENEVFNNLQIDKIDKILVLQLKGKDAPRNRTIFWLRHRQGLTATEIAAIPAMGLSTEGVESVLLRLVNMIRSHIKEADSA